MNQMEAQPLDLMPTRNMDASAPLRRFWNWDFCVAEAPPPAPPRMRSATMESHASSQQQEENGWEQVLHNAMSAWNQLWSPAKLAADTKSTGTTETKSSTSQTPREIQLDLAPTNEEEEEEEEEEKEVTTIIITEPGNSRAMRVYRGLELFLLTIFVLSMTLRLLSQSGIELAFVLEPNERRLG